MKKLVDIVCTNKKFKFVGFRLIWEYSEWADNGKIIVTRKDESVFDVNSGDWAIRRMWVDPDSEIELI